MRWFLRWLLLGLLAGKGMAAVHYDMTKAELLQELGKPVSTMVHPGSGREVLTYPKGVRIDQVGERRSGRGKSRAPRTGQRGAGGEG